MENIKIVVESKKQKTSLDRSMQYWAKKGIKVQNAYFKEIEWTNKDGTKHKKKFQCFKTDSKEVPELVFASGLLKKCWI